MNGSRAIDLAMAMVRFNIDRDFDSADISGERSERIRLQGSSIPDAIATHQTVDRSNLTQPSISKSI